MPNYTVAQTVGDSNKLRICDADEDQPVAEIVLMGDWAKLSGNVKLEMGMAMLWPLGNDEVTDRVAAVIAPHVRDGEDPAAAVTRLMDELEGYRKVASTF